MLGNIVLSLLLALYKLFILFWNHIVCMWAIVKTLGSRKGHQQIWEGPIAYHTFVQ